MSFRLLGDRRVGGTTGDITGLANGTLAEIRPAQNDILITTPDGEVISTAPLTSKPPASGPISLTGLAGGAIALAAAGGTTAEAPNAYTSMANRSGAQTWAFGEVAVGPGIQTPLAPVALAHGGFYLPLVLQAAPNPTWIIATLTDGTGGTIGTLTAPEGRNVGGMFFGPEGYAWTGAMDYEAFSAQFFSGSYAYGSGAQRVVVDNGAWVSATAGEQVTGIAAALPDGSVMQPYIDTVFSWRPINDVNTLVTNTAVSMRVVNPGLIGEEIAVNVEPITATPGEKRSSLVVAEAGVQAVALDTGAVAILWLEKTFGADPIVTTDDSWQFKARLYDAAGTALGAEQTVASRPLAGIDGQAAWSFIGKALTGGKLGLAYNVSDGAATDIAFAVLDTVRGNATTGLLVEGAGAQSIGPAGGDLVVHADGSLTLRYLDGALGLVTGRYVDIDPLTATVGTGTAAADTVALRGKDDWYDAEAGADTADGGRGNDHLDGGAGNDSLAGGKGGDGLTGGSGLDTLDGGGGADTLLGGLGGDSLTGGGGADIFRWLSAAEGGDRIALVEAVDRLQVSAAGFGGGLFAGMTLDATRFVANASGLATAPAGTGQFVHENDIGTLWWDVDGMGGAAAVRIADLGAGSVLSAAMIVVIG